MPETQLQKEIRGGVSQMGRMTIDTNAIYGGASIADSADHVFSYQLSFPRNIRAEVRIYGKDLRKQDVTSLMKQVGDLADAFDEEPSETGHQPTEVEGTQ